MISSDQLRLRLRIQKSPNPNAAAAASQSHGESGISTGGGIGDGGAGPRRRIGAASRATATATSSPALPAWRCGSPPHLLAGASTSTRPSHLVLLFQVLCLLAKLRFHCAGAHAPARTRNMWMWVFVTVALFGRLILKSVCIPGRGRAMLAANPIARAPIPFGACSAARIISRFFFSVLFSLFDAASG